PRGSGTVLFVDDEPALVELGRHMLAHLGYTPEPRTSPLEALAAFRANPDKFVAVVTDMTMPHMNGMTLAKEILKLRPLTPVILCTGFSDKTNEEKATAAGIQAFLHKPLTLNDLAQALQKITRNEKNTG
ncbi:MAG: response regulator, partial [Desulfobacterales bacterium]